MLLFCCGAISVSRNVYSYNSYDQSKPSYKGKGRLQPLIQYSTGSGYFRQEAVLYNKSSYVLYDESSYALSTSSTKLYLLPDARPPASRNGVS